MLSTTCVRADLAQRYAAHGLVIVLVVLTGGCSADVTRFDFPAFGLTESNNRPTGSLPPPSDQVARRHPSYDAPGAPPRGAGLGDAPYGGAANERVARGRDYAPPAYGAPPYNSPAAADAPPGPGPDRFASRPMDRTPDRASADRRVERPRTPPAGETIQVQQGDTLYGIAKRHGVSIGALIELNGLTNGSTIKPGQQLVLPAGASPARTVAEPVAPERTPIARYAPASPPAAQLSPGWGGRHTLRPGESLYGIARQHGVSLAGLQRVNGITEPTRVRAGTVLSVPGNAEPALERERDPPPAAPRVTQGTIGLPPPAQPRIINAPPGERSAALGDRATDATPPPAAVEPTATSRFRWPARGRVIAAFGKRPDGTHNDGINIAVPQGTDVHAAESGRVAYAGSELKGYGNLVLIRHDNGWVSAYAHADQILVKRDDVVRRGQVIARAGKTGTVDQPQLHFELRQGAKPVDPLPHMER